MENGTLDNYFNWNVIFYLELLTAWLQSLMWQLVLVLLFNILTSIFLIRLGAIFDGSFGIVELFSIVR